MTLRGCGPLYISGRHRGGRWKTHRNLMLTMLIGGL